MSPLEGLTSLRTISTLKIDFEDYHSVTKFENNMRVDWYCTQRSMKLMSNQLYNEVPLYEYTLMHFL